MTNEKLCTLIQQGQKEYLADLWEQTRRFGAMQARRYFVSLGNLGGVELEDLLQCRWIALLQAVRYFRAEKGCFLTFYGYTLKNAFREAAGLRSSKRDPLCDSLSLDAPAAEEEGGTLLDFVADPIDPLQPLEDDVYQQQLHAALERALSLLSPEREKHIRQRYYQGMSFRQIAQQEGAGRRFASRRKTRFKNCAVGPVRLSCAVSAIGTQSLTLIQEPALQRGVAALEAGRKNLQSIL